MFNLFVIRPKGFNIGNDAIYLGLRHFIHQAFGQVVNLINLPATSRYESQAKGGLTARTIYEINQFGHGVIVGGGNLYENGELDVSPDALKSLEVPLMLFSISRGRIYNRRLELVERTDVMPDRTLVELHKRADYSLARDRATHAYLHGLGCEKVRLGGCPTLFLNEIADTLPPLSRTDRGEALISLRHPSLMNIPLQKQSRVASDIRPFVGLLRERGQRDIRLLCHDHRDIAFAQSFGDLEYVYTDDIYTYLAMLRACSVNITYRLHSALPCFSFGTPTIHVGYDERANSLMKTAGLGEWNIDMVMSNDPVAEVATRLDRLPEFQQVRENARATWQQFGVEMTGAITAFANDVRRYAAGNIA